MTKLEKTTGIPGLDMGILHPQMKHLFRVEWMVGDKEVREALAIQAIRIKVDYANKKLLLTYEQPAVGGRMHEVLWEECKLDENTSFSPRQHVIRVTAMGGKEQHNHVIDYHATVVTHNYDLDYAISGMNKRSICTHEFEFKIKHVVVVDPKRTEPKETTDENTNSLSSILCT